jgi:ABC-type transport system involved in multi-copper enzyme maturation permease subunit
VTFLPIVVRELNVASRRKATFWTRMIFAGLAVVIATLTLLYVGVLQPRPGLGAGVFRALSGLGFAFCALAGVFLTADALSEEKREGTLGLLFLTDLRGYDVVLGKLLATSLTAFYGVFALFPVLALTLILGGVTAGEFWRMTLVFLNTMFLSLAAGLFVSALGREAQRALGVTGLLLLAMVVLPPVLDFGLSIASSRLPVAVLQFSPLWGWMRSFDGPYGGSRGDFWRSLVAVHTSGWALLGLAAVLLPRVWQEGQATLFRRSSSPALTPAGLARRAEQQRRLMMPNPISWLARRGPVPAWMHWIGFALLAGLLAFANALFGSAAAGPLASITGWVFPTALRAVVAIEACRFFVEARQTGVLELLLCAPVSTARLLEGQWHALIHRFWVPVVIAVGVRLAPVIMALATEPRGVAWAVLPAGLFSVLGVIGLLLDLFATAWVSMLLGLTARKPGRAAGYAVLWMVLLPSVIPCFPMFLLDLPLIFWARGRLHRELRSIAIRPFAPGPVGEGVSPAQSHPPRTILRGS